MTEFHRVEITDREWAAPILLAENTRSADYNFGNIYLWDGTYHQFVAQAGGRMLVKLRYAAHPFFAFPVGSGDLRPALEAMAEVAAARGFPFAIRGVTEEQRALLEETCPGRFAFTENRDCFDYLYDAEKLAAMAGKKLHGKRNHCNRFEAGHDWDFVPMTRDLIPACMEMLGLWTNELETPTPGLEDEHAAILRAFIRYDALGLEGGVLRAEGRIIGFTVGERTSADTYDVHFEKAFSSINGAYPMVCREYARMLLARHPEVRFLNREDDMGHENLRTAKLDFFPEYLLAKYTAQEV